MKYFQLFINDQAHRNGFKMAYNISQLPESVDIFLATTSFGALSSIDVKGSLHTAVVGFHFNKDEKIIRIISNKDSQKVKNIQKNNQLSLCQVSGNKWISFFGTGIIHTTQQKVKEATNAYASRYQEPGDSTERIAIEIKIEKMLGNA
jgi:general stress protein 26